MKVFILILTGFLCATFAISADQTALSRAKVVDLRVEHMTNPQAVNHPLPRFGWRIETGERAYVQASYFILAASTPALLAQDKGDLWESGEKQARASQFITFGGSQLNSGQTVHWKVKSKDRSGNFTPWSSPATFTIQLSGPPSLPSPVFLPVSDAPRLSKFECSDPNLNAIFEAAAQHLHEINGARDIGLTMRSAAFHQNILSHGSAWVNQLNASVDAAGFYPATLPSSGSFGSTQSDAAISSIHALWWMTGDKAILERYINTMHRYVLARVAIDPKHLGLPFGALPVDTFPAGDLTPPELVHLTSGASNIRLLLEMNRFFTDNPYAALALQKNKREMGNSFRNRYLEEDGSLKSNSLTATLIALRCGLLTPEEQQSILSDLPNKLGGDSLANNFPQSPTVAHSLLPTLSLTGHSQKALDLVQSLDAKNMSPMALACVSEWIISRVAGIDAESPGFKNILIQPFITDAKELSFAKAHYDSPNGRISTHWRHKGNKTILDVVIPPNTTAKIKLPTSLGAIRSEDGQPVAAAGIHGPVKKEEGMTSFHLTSGTHRFEMGD